MRGRGRGRGGRGGRGNVATDLLKDNLDDLGIDIYSFRGSNTAPAPLFPPISIKQCGKISDEDLYAIQKMRELTQR